MLSAKEIKAVECEAKRVASLIPSPVRVSTPFEKGAKFCGIVDDRIVDVMTALEKPVLKEKPRNCHGACKNFSAAQYGTGSCALDKCPVVPDKVGCKDWESTGDDRLLAEVVSKRTKYLAGV